MDSLDTEIQFIKGVGPRNVKLFHKLGILTARDLLFSLPRRYQDRTNLPPIAEAKVGQYATVKGRVRRIESRTVSGGRVILKAVIEDRTGALTLSWFNQPWVKKQLEEAGGEIIAYGMVKEAGHLPEISSPEWEPLSDDVEQFARIVPVYSLTEGLSQKVFRSAAQSIVQKHAATITDPLPESFRNQLKLPPLAWSLQQLHSPESLGSKERARKRIAFEEFFYLQLELAMRRAATHQELGISFPIDALIRGEEFPESREDDPDLKKPDSSKPESKRRPTSGQLLPQDLFFEEKSQQRQNQPLWPQIDSMFRFDLTRAQRRVIGEIFEDMKRPFPMNRLVQGDVGSGKTAVAASCILAAVRSGYQCALMAPTEILAEQHAKSLRQFLEPLGIEVVLLVGKLSGKERKFANQRIESGAAQVAIGTHALIQEGVKFQNLGLVVVDEQHRFGVLQRKALRDKGVGNPDVLVMTATPIPRTLTMTIYGDLDLSIIDELPPGRKPIKTRWKKPSDRKQVYQGVRELLQQGRQAYFVCPLVSETEKMMALAAEALYQQLAMDEFPDFRVGLLHGQMKSAEKDEVMSKFRDHELDILVSTTVIEVGVDVPNASIMIIEDANRFGLAQLHQLRGRVGRGQHQSFCILICETKTDDSVQRIGVMTESTDGFVIAEKDLEIRGPGNLVGTEQSGIPNFKVADLVQDLALLENARQVAISIIEKDPNLQDPQWQSVLQKIHERRSDQALLTIS